MWGTRAPRGLARHHLDPEEYIPIRAHTRETVALCSGIVDALHRVGLSMCGAHSS